MKKLVLLAALGLLSLMSTQVTGLITIPLKKRPVNKNLYPNSSPGTLRNVEDIVRKTGGIIEQPKKSEGISLKIAGVNILEFLPSTVNDFVQSLFVKDNLSLATLLRNSDDMFYVADVFVGSNK